METMVLAVIGPHGAGKTSFIQSVTDSEPINLPQSPAVVEDGHIRYTPPGVPDVSLHRCNMGCGQTPFILIDTPGLCARADNLPDYGTVDFVKDRLDRAGVRLHGVIYLQRIMETTSADFAARNLDWFCAMFRSDEFRHVVVATTFWDVSPKLEPMSDDFFLGELRRLGVAAQSARLRNDREASEDLLWNIGIWPNSYPYGIHESGDEPPAYTLEAPEAPEDPEDPEAWEDIIATSNCCTM
ncbi:hypothetical protein LZ30DRAFT_589184 [Colletotrichum cereale]|nr:hypothetical protein LZ30DRAFT_589184 [Colletotrichum cereale]